VKQDVQGPPDYNTDFLLKEEENNKEVVENVECSGLAISLSSWVTQ